MSLDVARILLKGADALRHTDISDTALQALATVRSSGGVCDEVVFENSWKHPYVISALILSASLLHDMHSQIHTMRFDITTVIQY